jgi:hypothetical protein
MAGMTANRWLQWGTLAESTSGERLSMDTSVGKCAQGHENHLVVTLRHWC